MQTKPGPGIYCPSESNASRIPEDVNGLVNCDMQRYLLSALSPLVTNSLFIRDYRDTGAYYTLGTRVIGKMLRQDGNENVRKAIDLFLHAMTAPISCCSKKMEQRPC